MIIVTTFIVDIVDAGNCCHCCRRLLLLQQHCGQPLVCSCYCYDYCIVTAILLHLRRFLVFNTFNYTSPIGRSSMQTSCPLLAVVGSSSSEFEPYSSIWAGNYFTCR